MLTKREKKVLNVLLKLSKKDNTCLTNHEEIVSHLSAKDYLTRKEVDDIVNNLSLQNYIDVILTDNKGTKNFCITIKSKGEGFVREEKDNKKTTVKRILFTVVLAVVSFAVTMILRAIF